jgi:Xaa-Pro aminopeptidase
LDVHESPNISAKNKEKLKKDMTITVEPGIYISKKFGVRIEDSLIVKDRAAVMHKFTKDLIVI